MMIRGGRRGGGAEVVHDIGIAAFEVSCVECGSLS